MGALAGPVFRFVKRAWWWVAAIFIVVFTMAVVGIFHHPFGGGRFHAIFAHAEVGRIHVAVEAIAVDALVACVVVAILVWSARDVGLLPGQWAALIVATIGLAGLCVWIIGWEE